MRRKSAYMWMRRLAGRPRASLRRLVGCIEARVRDSRDCGMDGECANDVSWFAALSLMQTMSASMFECRRVTRWPPNGLELSCPAEAGRLSPTLRHAGGPGKLHPRPSPPGQLQRVVRRRTGMLSLFLQLELRSPIRPPTSGHRDPGSSRSNRPRMWPWPGLRIFAPASLAWAMTASTSLLVATLWPIVISVGLWPDRGMPASCEMLPRGQRASLRPGCKSKKATAPCSNS